MECAYSAYLIAEIAGILVKTEDVETYTQIYNNYRTDWRETFLEADGYTTQCGTQTSYVLGIKFGLFDPQDIPKAAANLVKNIKRWNWHLSTGFLGYSFLNMEAGKAQAVFRNHKKCLTNAVKKRMIYE